MIFIKRSLLQRRTFLRGAGATLALPLLEAMLPHKAHAQQEPKRFFGFFYPNGTDPNFWEISGSKLNSSNLSRCLTDLKGFGSEGIWPSCSALYDDITLVNNLHHDVYNAGLHQPSMSLQAHKVLNDRKTTAPSLDQKIIQKTENRSIHPHLQMSSADITGINQTYLSFKGADNPADIDRSPKVLFNKLFGAVAGSSTEADIVIRKQSILDFVSTEATKLNRKLGLEDRQRVQEYQNSIREIELQIQTVNTACVKENFTFNQQNWHDKSKMFIDIAVLAMSCDLTRVATLLYSNSWGVDYKGYLLGDGKPDAAGTIGLGGYTDHFISHRIGQTDSAGDLEALPFNVKKKLADDRLILASRFKVRRFSYLVDKLRSTETPTGNLLDSSLALYCSEIGTGDSHSKRRMPTLLAGRAGGFAPGRIINANGKHTAALHCAVLNKFGYQLNTYGDPAEGPLAGV